MTEKTASDNLMNMLYALELKNKLYECLTSPEDFDAKQAEAYYRELIESNKGSEVLDSSILQLYEQRKNGESVGSQKTQKNGENKKSRKILCFIAVSLLLIAVIAAGFFMRQSIRAAMFKADPEVQRPLHVSDQLKTDCDWSRYRDSLIIACDEMNMKIKFPEWLPPEMECYRVWSTAADDIYEIRADFVHHTDSEYDPTRKPREITITVQKYFDDSVDEIVGGGGIWSDTVTYYKTEKIDGLEYYIGAAKHGEGYIAVAIADDYVYTLDCMCDYQTLIKIIKSLAPL